MFQLVYTQLAAHRKWSTSGIYLNFPHYEKLKKWELHSYQIVSFDLVYETFKIHVSNSVKIHRLSVLLNLGCAAKDLTIKSMKSSLTPNQNY